MRSRTDPESHLEPGDARVVAVGIAASPEDDDHDDADGHQAADPTQRECRPRRSSSGRPEEPPRLAA
jgi:hypothetical protein